MILNVHIPGAPDHEIGHDIWQEPLADAIRFEAENVAFYSPDQAHRDELRDRIIAEMTAALTQIGDAYTAPTAFCTRSATATSRTSSSR